MPKKEREPQLFPTWLVTALACRVCGGPSWEAGKGGMVCRKVPAHTGHIMKYDVDTRAVEAHAIELAHGRTDWNREKAVIMAHRYLRASSLTPCAADEVLW